MPIFNHELDTPLTEEEMENERKLITQQYRELLRTFKNPLNDDDQRLVREAFELAAEAHKKQRRKDGTPYITHPIAVARICVEEIGLGPTAAACALLHDVVEDTEITLEELRQKFPDKIQPEREKNDKSPVKTISRVANIVEGLTKLDSLHEYEYPQAENIRRVLEAMLTDMRVVLIKMADRLHNLRTISSMKEDKQLKIAAETDSIYTPLAHQLGLYKVKTEFQDNCLKITNRAGYDDIARKLSQTKSVREEYIQKFIDPIKRELEEYGLKAEVFGRPKSIHSIYEKMTKKKVEFENIFDLFAIRIVLEGSDIKQERMQCWQAYAIVTDCYKPIPERQKDWISIPKTNGYESLHISVIGPDGRFVEVQIRSSRMDDIAERGFAAHWKYKGVNGFGQQSVFDKWLSELRETLKDKNNPVEFIADFQSTIYVEDVVQVFTPKGDIRILPKGSTALDFAFSIHSDVGSTCQVVKVHGVLQPFNYKLQTGDQIEIVTNRNQKPTEDWLLYVVTTKAKTRIKAALNEEKRKLADQGKEILARKLHNTHKVGVEENVDFLAKFFGYPNRLEFLSAIAVNKFNFSQLKKFRVEGRLLVQPEPAPKQDNEQQPTEVLQTTSRTGNRRRNRVQQAVIINDEPGVYFKYEFGNCCTPEPGEAIFAYLNSNQEAIIHTATCKNAKYLLTNYAFRFLKAEWGNVVRERFASELIITGRDIGKGVIREISECIERLGINMQSFSMSGDDGGHFQGNVILEVSTPEHLNLAISALKNFEYVTDVQEKRLEM